MAKKDAAFQAYVALYLKGLVNDNLLPLLLTKDEGIVADIETRASFEEVSEIFNPWISLAKSWMEPGDFLKRKLISITRPSLPTLYLTMALPQELPALESFTIYWDSQTTYTISVNDTAQTPNTDTPFIPIMRQVTSTIFQAVHSNRMPSGRDDFLALFIPHISERFLRSWLEENAGNFPAAEILNMKRNATFGLVRDQARYAAPHIFEGTNDDGTINVTRLPKRRDFLHHGYAIKPDNENEVDVSEKPALFLPLESSTVDKLPLEYVECSLLIPSIMHRLWRQSLALDLYNTVFEGQGFLNLDYIITATNTPSANENSNYQRLEFIGDSVLKYLVCLNLYASHPSWPEGYLSRAKDQAVANSRLSRASLAAGLDRYIVTKSFTARKWSPPYIREILEAESSPEKRTLSTKVLADVVEALIGGSYLDSGFDAAATCISRFIPEVPITTPLHIFSGAYNAAESAFVPTSLASSHLSDVERIIGYQFKDRSYLLEAITHPSCEHDANTSSYQRLEFIGDAALDMIVVSFMIDNAPELSHGKMHLTKTAVVNAGFLAYLCLDASLDQDVIDVCLSPDHGPAAFTEVHSTRLVHLCQLMRHQHPDISTEMISCLGRYHELQPAVSAAINHGNEYPWVQLASLAPAKFISDIIESIIGAILIDSGGDLGTCTKVAEHLGLIGYLRRILNGNIDILHPKNKLGEMVLDRRVDYKLGKDGEEYTCTVEVGGTAIVSVSQGISQEEVMTRAAYMAAELLR
jgi:dsRNA-specific ribonuclease